MTVDSEATASSKKAATSNHVIIRGQTLGCGRLDLSIAVPPLNPCKIGRVHILRHVADLFCKSILGFDDGSHGHCRRKAVGAQCTYVPSIMTRFAYLRKQNKPISALNLYLRCLFHCLLSSVQSPASVWKM